VVDGVQRSKPVKAFICFLKGFAGSLAEIICCTAMFIIQSRLVDKDVHQVCVPGIEVFFILLMFWGSFINTKERKALVLDNDFFEATRELNVSIERAMISCFRPLDQMIVHIVTILKNLSLCVAVPFFKCVLVGKVLQQVFYCFLFDGAILLERFLEEQPLKRILLALALADDVRHC